MQLVRRNFPVLLIMLMSILLVAFKWNSLSLPYYWDEGFPYSYAVRYMADHGLSLMSDSIPPLYSRGHPLLFHFLAALWMKIAGTNVATMRLFPLLVSSILLFSVYRLGKITGDKWTGIFAALLLTTHSLFITQSSFLLPETLLALFSVLTLNAWLSDKKTLYIIFGSLLLLTKEPGIILIFTLGLIDFVSNIRNKKPVKNLLYGVFISAAPLLPAISFFILQKLQLGWYLYPMHLDSFHSELQAYFDELFKGLGSFFFVYYGGIFITVTTIIAFIIAKIRRSVYSPPQVKYITAILVFLPVSLLFFSSFSFPIQRYLLCLFGPWYILVVLLIQNALPQLKRAVIAIIIMLSGIQLGYTWDIRSKGDYDLGYVDVITTQRDAVRWCVSNGFKDKIIFAQHQLQRGMQSEAGGFVSTNEIFHEVSNANSVDADVYIFTCNESDTSDETAKKQHLVLAKRFESGKAWTEIYLPEK